MREIVLDTETTGFDPSEGHRVVEIGCIELINHMPTAASFHVYLNPERDMPQAAFNVHGLSGEFLRDKPRFAEIAEEFAAFLGDSALVIYNASFDLAFLNAEFARLGLAAIPADRATDTLMLARRRHPGAPASLDALCKRFGVDNSGRIKHGALLDAELLAEVYLELIGGRQPGLTLSLAAAAPAAKATSAAAARPPRAFAPDEAELAAHAAFVAGLKNSLWSR